MDVRVRPATLEDDQAIEAVHERSVRELAAEAYRDAVVEAWVSTSADDDRGHHSEDGDEGEEDADDEAEATETEAMQPDNGRLFVAVVHDGDGSETVAGFGDVRFDPPEYLEEPAEGGVRAVYVDPEYAGEGAGAALLERLEAEALDRGLTSLGLLASVNARGFYAHHGYEAVEERSFDFGSGVEGPAVEMRTDLADEDG